MADLDTKVENGEANETGASAPSPAAAPRSSNSKGQDARTKVSKSATTSKSEAASPNLKKSKSAPAPWTFPKNSLEDALIVVRSIEEQNAGNPMKSDMLVKAVGFNTVNDWRYLELLRSANQYGIVEGSGRHATVKLTEIGQDIVSPSTPKARQNALVKAFHSVDQFSKVEQFYSNKKLPEDEFFENTLIRDFGISRDRVRAFIDIFTKNLNFLHAFRASDARGQPLDRPEGSLDRQPIVPPAEEQADSARTFLDTCFVMMPFGPWLDQYYREIFVPAIKDAGMEPVRGDELFSTGSVIEQIWDQVKRAKVLLADLTGKNANVFYELGLAHAACKPVVFTTANLDDVPFDLRHLRVVTYDIRDPAWGLKLQKSLATYLRAAKTDPAKSVPQPFRAIQLDEEQ
jgi:DNA-directed RNA polymerase subunit N (RpoN/RPB10)